MKIKPYLKYLIYIILIMLIVLTGNPIIANIDFKIKTNPYMSLLYAKGIYTFIFYFSIGLVLGFDNLITQLRKNGSWKINIPKLVLLGLPSLYFSLYYLISLNNTSYKYIIRPLEIIIGNNVNYFEVFQTILGFIIISSIYKEI